MFVLFRNVKTILCNASSMPLYLSDFPVLAYVRYSRSVIQMLALFRILAKIVEAVIGNILTHLGKH